MKKLLACFVVLMAISTVSGQSALFVGHRGASYLAPENTLASLNLAFDIGAKAVECDIMMTADNQVIVFHDKKGKRLTGIDFTVAESNYADISSYPINLRESNRPEYEGQTIPLLKDFLENLRPDRTLVIEIKTGTEILPYMKDVIDLYWKTGSIAFIAFDLNTILETKKLYPEVPCYYLSAFGIDVKKKFKTIGASDLDGVDLRSAIIDEKLAAKLQRAGKDIWCWTVNEPDEAKRMLDLGITAITTDRPVWLEQQVSQAK